MSIIFADDTTGISSAGSVTALENLTNEELLKAKKWFLLNELHLNQSKTRVIHYNLPQTNKPNISFSNEPIIEVVSNNVDTSNRSFKFLGFEIDERLDFKSHISKVSKNLF